MADDEPPEELISDINDYYQNLLGYSVENTALKLLSEEQWNFFCRKNNLNEITGVYLPRSQTAVVPEDNPLSLFHEYFGHGLFCEQSLAGRKLVDLEKKLLEEEKQEFQEKQFSLEDIQKFRGNNRTFQELNELSEKNLRLYETFALFSEYILSKRFDLEELFEKKYRSLISRSNIMNTMINFSKECGDLSIFYQFGLARRTTPERVRKLLEGIYGKENIDKSRLILLAGSKKPFSDIDLFASSNYLPSTKKQWLDLVVLDEKDFERRLKLFEVQIICPISSGEFVAGDKKYWEQKKKQLLEQPITNDAIQYNLKLSKEQRELALIYPPEERKIGLSYSQTYLANALALKKGKRLFTKEDLISYSHNEKFIELKGGIK